MASLDSSTPLKRIGTTALAVADGTTPTANSISVIFEGSISFTVSGASVIEATSQGKHKTTPVVVETQDQVTSIEFDGYITSFKGSSNTHIYEALTRTGTASSWKTTSDGDGYCVKLTVTYLESKATSPSTQEVVFAFAHPDSVQIEAGTEDAVRFSASFTNYENYPTVT
jgi:hypothetical protein